MIQLRDYVVIKEKVDNKTVVRPVEYQKTYYSHGPNDPTEEVEFTAEGETVKDAAGNSLKKQQPKEKDKSIHDVNDLFQQAIADLQAKEPKLDPIFTTLRELTYGSDLGVRASIRQANTAKPIDENKAYQKMAENLVRMKKFPDVAAAITALKAMGM